MTRKILFTPELDITAYELATILGNVLIVANRGSLRYVTIPVEDDIWDEMSPGERRHWTVQS